MKIISLNCYLGNVYESLMDFLKHEAPTTDVFCLQEMLSNPKEDAAPATGRGGRPNLLQECIRRLPDFAHAFAPMQDDFDTTPDYPGQSQLGVAIFYKKSLRVSDQGSFFIYNQFNSYRGSKDWESVGHAAAFIQIERATPITIVTLHGNSQPGSKLDTPKRLEQSQKILDFLAPRSGEKIVMGDFNLFPETESIRLFERAGLRNLIVEYNISTTRGSLRNKLFPEYANSEYGFQEFADYTFVSPGLTTTSFEVPDVPISDHLPMILEFDAEA